MAVVTTTTTMTPFYTTAWFWIIVIGFIFLLIGIGIYFFFQKATTWVWVFVGLGLLLIIGGAIYAAFRPSTPVPVAPPPAVRKVTTTTAPAPVVTRPSCTLPCMNVPGCDIGLATMGQTMRVAPGLPVGVPITPVG